MTDVNDNCPQFVGTDNSTNDSFMAAVSEVLFILRLKHRVNVVLV